MLGIGLLLIIGLGIIMKLIKISMELIFKIIIPFIILFIIYWYLSTKTPLSSYLPYFDFSTICSQIKASINM